MNNFNNPFFQALFNTRVPRVIIELNAPEYTIIASNDAYKHFTESENKYIKSKILRKIFTPDSMELDDLEVTTIPGTDSQASYFLISINNDSYQSENDRKSLERIRVNPENKLATIIKNIPAALAILSGPDMVLEVVNTAMLQLWHRDESIYGKPLLKFLPELKDQDFPGILEDVFTTGLPYSTTDAAVKLTTPDGIQQVYMDFSYTPLLNEEGKTERILVLALDVTERTLSRMREQQLKEELIVMNEELADSITTQVQARKKAESSEQRISFLLDAIPQQVWTVSPAGILQYVNKIMCDDLGKDAENLILDGWQQYLHPEDFRRCMHKYLSAIKSGQEYVDEFRILFRDGKYHWHLGKLVPFYEKGKIELWLGTNTNIDFQKSNEIKKDEFFSIASHELKTPLTTIKALNQLLKNTTSPEKINSFINKSSESILRLERLIDDLLDVTKINTGKMVYIMKPFDFKKMLEESIANVQHTSKQRIILEQAVDMEYTGDVFRLKQVIQNILTNAVRYSPKTLRVLVNAKIEQAHVVVTVQDFGIGIPEQDLHRLFERYYRAENTSMRFQGLGLGLYIASEILSRHQGRFWIESKEGNGSTFFIQLPLKKS
jgi:PAS domain S-box-containing protein